MDSIIIKSIDELDSVAHWLDQKIAATSCSVVALYGAMGAGKTTLISRFTALHNAKQQASSPTFAIINTYDTPNITLYHFDFYRIDTVKEIEDLALGEYFYDTNSISLVEWPEKIEQFLPGDITLRIKIDITGNDSRKFSVIR
ncbi:MAG: tRNA (adenosine(37)-N6)-threonylcarbamoyltransferase complex ATPase subunit type 1 TsaE [Mucinivorans sp.]